MLCDFAARMRRQPQTPPRAVVARTRLSARLRFCRVSTCGSVLNVYKAATGQPFASTDTQLVCFNNPRTYTPSESTCRLDLQSLDFSPRVIFSSSHSSLKYSEGERTSASPSENPFCKYVCPDPAPADVVQTPWYAASAGTSAGVHRCQHVIQCYPTRRLRV